MNLKIISFIAAAVLAVVVSAQPEPPECTIGENTEACTTPFGHEGYFVTIVKDESWTRPPNAGGAGAGAGRPGGFRGGRPGGFGGRGGGMRMPGRGLSGSKCVPIDAPEPDDDNEGRDFDGNGPILEINCGCDGVCPTPISCDCDCTITLPFGATMNGSKATVTKRDGSTVTKCVPPVYADVDNYNCITDCSIEVDTPFL